MCFPKRRVDSSVLPEAVSQFKPVRQRQFELGGFALDHGEIAKRSNVATANRRPRRPVLMSERKRTSRCATGAAISRVVHQMRAGLPGSSAASITSVAVDSCATCHQSRFDANVGVISRQFQTQGRTAREWHRQHKRSASGFDRQRRRDAERNCKRTWSNQNRRVVWSFLQQRQWQCLTASLREPLSRWSAEFLPVPLRAARRRYQPCRRAFVSRREV